MIQLFKPKIYDEAIEEVGKVLKSGWIGLGPKTEEFEKKFAEYIGCKYAVAVNSCTSALHLAVKLCNFNEGDEIITTPLTFVSTNHVLLYERLTPVFADVDLMTYCVDPKSIEKMITKKTKGIMVVHYGGYPAPLGEIYELANKYNLKVIEDAAHACGSDYLGKRIGSIGDLTCFSFHAVKNLPVGDGGMITTNNEEYYYRLKKLAWLGIDKGTYTRNIGKYAWEYNVDEVGFKYHTNDITAAIGLVQLKHLEEANGFRRKVADLYTELLSDKPMKNIVSLPIISNNIVHSRHIYPIRINNRDEVIMKLKENDIAVGVHYRLNTRYPMYSNCRRECPNAEIAERQLISLPMHLELKDNDIYKIASVIKE